MKASDLNVPPVPTALEHDKAVTKAIIQRMAAISAVQAVNPDDWKSLLAEARQELQELVFDIASDNHLGGLTNPEAQLRILQSTIRIEFLEIFTEQLQSTVPTSNQPE